MIFLTICLIVVMLSGVTVAVEYLVDQLGRDAPSQKGLLDDDERRQAARDLRRALH